jgi:glyoxylase-like metal-dependent hydrolase (beta-lactamase superfamily II)
MRRFHEIAPGVLVATAELYTTTSTVVTGADGGCLVIDPAVAVSELAGLASRLARTGLRPRAGFATHPHWDHVLWHHDLGQVPRYATPAAVATAERQRGELIGAADAEVPGHDPELVGRLVALPGNRVPWDGPEALVIAHDGHAPGHGAVFLPDTGVLMAGDMLSDIEIPLLDVAGADPLGDYRAGLERLAALEGVRWLVPGHGSAGDAGEFRRRVEADFSYLERLGSGEAFEDPRCNQDWLRQEYEAQRRLIRS